jgi:exodeoxyribonuclease V alpha subunit
VSRIDMEESELGVDFEGRKVVYGFAELDELALAYATTIHKSQGSENPTLVIPLTTQHYFMLQRNLWETPSRAGRAAQGVGDHGRGRARRRWSKLRERLIGCDCHSVAAGSDEPNRGFSRKRA